MTRPAWWTALGGTLATALMWPTGIAGTVTMAACAVASTWCVERVTR